MTEPFADGETRGFLHRPETQAQHPFPLALALTHGAGSNCQCATTRCSGRRVRRRRVSGPSLRSSLPPVRASGPPRPGDAARDREGILAAVASLERLVGGRVFLGGHSYGGRQSTMLAAENPTAARGLLLLSYPLHPPRQPATCAPPIFLNSRRGRYSCMAPAILSAPWKRCARLGSHSRRN